MRHAALIAALALAFVACGEKEESEVGAPTSPTTAPAEPGGTADGDDGKPGGGEGVPKPGRDATSERRREAERIVRRYVRALDARDGAQVCALLAPGVLAALRPPREGPTCAASLDASIGYRDPRGLPQFEGVSLADVISVKADPRSARVTATVVTNFADRAEPSIEDDIVYLRRTGGSYLIAKPSATLYRAVGAEPPLRAIVPPG